MAGVAVATSARGMCDGPGETDGSSVSPLDMGMDLGMGLDTTGTLWRKSGGVDDPLLRPSGSAGGFWLEDVVCTGRASGPSRRRNSLVARTAAVSITKRGWLLNRKESSAWIKIASSS